VILDRKDLRETFWSTLVGLGVFVGAFVYFRSEIEGYLGQTVARWLLVGIGILALLAVADIVGGWIQIRDWERNEREREEADRRQQAAFDRERQTDYATEYTMHTNETVRVPLPPSKRIRRGFNRIGYVVAIPTLVIGLSAAVGFGFSQASENQRRYEQLSCVQKQVATSTTEIPALSYDKERIDLRKFGCDGPMSGLRFTEMFDRLPAKPDFVSDFLPTAGGIAAGTLALAAISFGFFAALGWIVAGFARD
jgi:hypothetical protein